MSGPKRVIPLLLMVWLGCAHASTDVDTGGSEAHAEVVSAVEQMFAAMKNHDVEALRARVIDGARIYRVTRDDTGAVRHDVVTDTQFVEGTAGDDTHEVDERFTSRPRVQIDGAIASLWGPYEVYLDGTRMHCGVDTVQLVRQGAEWRVAAVTYTARECDSAR